MATCFLYVNTASIPDITEELDTFLRQGNYGAFSFLDLSKVSDIVNTSFY